MTPCTDTEDVLLVCERGAVADGHADVTDFPEPQLGDSRLLGLDQDVCFDRFGRQGAYGLQDPSMTDEQRNASAVDWDGVDWADLQQQCLRQNRDRFNMAPRPRPTERHYEHVAPNSHLLGYPKRPLVRSAILFRCYDNIKFSKDMIRTVRSVIMETSLGSGAEFEAFLLLQVKDTSIPIFEDEAVYRKVVEETVPKEFWSITVLWNEALWDTMYPRVPQKFRE